jgi:hypothetical protein
MGQYDIVRQLQTEAPTKEKSRRKRPLTHQPLEGTYSRLMGADDTEGSKLPEDSTAVPASGITEPTIEPAISGSTDRPIGRVSHRRTTRRVSFEYYSDQINQLKQFSLEEQLQGDKGNMSQMVREAVDVYIAKRRRTPK